MLGNVGLGQLLLIVLIIILVIGPRRILEFGRRIGRIPGQLRELPGRVAGFVSGPGGTVETGRVLGRICRQLRDRLRELTGIR